MPRLQVCHRRRLHRRWESLPLQQLLDQVHGNADIAAASPARGGVMTPILHALPLLLWFLAIWLLVGGER